MRAARAATASGDGLKASTRTPSDSRLSFSSGMPSSMNDCFAKLERTTM